MLPFIICKLESLWSQWLSGCLLCGGLVVSGCASVEDPSASGTPEAAAALYGGAAEGAKGILFLCQDGHQFQLFFNIYSSGDMRMKLQDDQVMLSDRQTHSAHLLTRVPSASGSHYQGDGFDLWNKGKEAFIDQDKQPLYRQCLAQ